MTNNTENIILKILEAIDYADDREVFVKEFTELVQIQAMDKLIISLPEDQQDTLKNELRTNQENLEKIGEILKSRFSMEQMQKSLEETSAKAVTEWMQAISPTLTDVQKQKLVSLSQEFNPAPPPAPAV
ncbi:MAG TPA: hypothetical protein VNA13_01160 [Xanthomonadales bacterium]|nr:hypothetical protein [Xanthomonadales bacterium]